MQTAEVFGLDHWRFGQTGLKRGENLNTFDGVDAEIAVEAHVEFEHLHGVPGFVGDDFKEDGLGAGILRDRCGMGVPPMFFCSQQSHGRDAHATF